MRRTKRGRKAQVSREGGKGEWGGGEGFIGCPEIALRAFQRPYDKN